MMMICGLKTLSILPLFPHFILCRINSKKYSPATSATMGVLVAQSCPTCCDPMNRSPQGSSVLGTFQARILEWVAIPFSRGSSRLRDQTRIYIYTYIPSLLELPRIPPLWVTMSTELNSPCYTAASHSLSVLHMALLVCQSQSPN